MSYKEAFGNNFDIDSRLTEYLNNNNWKDTSYHNDAAPSFTLGNYTLWIAERSRETREYPDGGRYMLTFEETDQDPKMLFNIEATDELLTKLTSTIKT